MIEAAPGGVLSRRLAEATIVDAVASFGVAGRRVLVVVPDATRSAPLAALYPVLVAELRAQRASAVTTVVALGTHRPLRQEELARLLGGDLDGGGRGPGGAVIVNHAWHDGHLLDCGELSATTMAELSNAMVREPVPVRVNRLVAENDLAIVFGPVFPHEVVGFSGGNKYFFPGISGPEMIDWSHWLGCLITSREIIGKRGTTPVRAMIDAAARRIPIERRLIALVVSPEAAVGGDLAPALRAIYAGTCEEAFEAAAGCSALVHVRRVPSALRRVVAVMPRRYEDMWTAAKGMYKLEPVVADGGELVILAPHVREFSTVHGADLAGVGYHVRDYFLAQLDRFAAVPRAVLAHSTHLRGQGSYDAATGVETARVEVKLATGIDARRCAAMALGYVDPDSLDLDAVRADPESLVVEDAGEVLYRLEGESDVWAGWPTGAAVGGR